MGNLRSSRGLMCVAVCGRGGWAGTWV